jgi:hypothetical protein
MWRGGAIFPMDEKFNCYLGTKTAGPPDSRFFADPG